MRQLTGLDAAFLQLETPTTPMHIAGLSLYDPSGSPYERLTVAAALDFLAGRLHLAPAMRRRLVEVPMGLDHPYWIEDPDFRLERHLHHLVLPQPADWTDLCRLASRLHEAPLDRSRPLWEITFIDGIGGIAGLPAGAYGVVSKIHHAAIDGVSGAELMVALNDWTREAVAPPPAVPWTPERVPPPGELLGRAAVSPWIRSTRWAGLAWRALPALGRVGAGLGRGELRLPRPPGLVPRTRFNHTVSASRVFDARSFDLEDVKTIKREVEGATVNDAVLAICGGALRRYLGELGELPEGESLVAMTPVSVRTEEERGAGGNLVSLMLVPLGTHMASPLDRLRHVHEQALASKAMSGAIGPRLLTDATETLDPVPTAFLASLYARLHAANWVRPLFNCIVTNVPGPQQPLYSAGARLVAHSGLGPVLDGIGLMMPVFSYCGALTVSVVSCPEMVPDAKVLADCLEDSFLELRSAVHPKGERVASRRRPPVETRPEPKRQVRRRLEQARAPVPRAQAS